MTQQFHKTKICLEFGAANVFHIDQIRVEDTDLKSKISIEAFNNKFPRIFRIPKNVY